jgi:hypothetical protein
MSSVSGAAGHAALAICESVLLSLTENKIIDEAEARAILEDVAAAHRNAIPLLIEAILKGVTQCGMPELEPRSNLS